MLEESIKDHPIVVGDFSQWLVINSGRKEATDAKIVATKLKDKADELSSSTNFDAKSINKLKNSIAYENKSSKTTIRKLGSLANK